jgi:hypothetical protein
MHVEVVLELTPQITESLLQVKVCTRREGLVIRGLSLFNAAPNNAVSL